MLIVWPNDVSKEDSCGLKCVTADIDSSSMVEDSLLGGAVHVSRCVSVLHEEAPMHCISTGDEEISVHLEKDGDEFIDCYCAHTLGQLSSRSSSHSTTSVIASKPITTMIAVTTASVKSVRFAASNSPSSTLLRALCRIFFLIQFTVRPFTGNAEDRRVRKP
jgi:hypothetical protein